VSAPVTVAVAVAVVVVVVGVTGLDPSRALVPRTVVDAVVAEAE